MRVCGNRLLQLFLAAGVLTATLPRPAAAQLTDLGSLLLTECDDPGSEECSDLDLFGVATATGDFNGDGFADLALGVPGKGDDGRRDGRVRVFFGAAGGLSTKSPQILRHTTCLDESVIHSRVPLLFGETVEFGFGSALAAGDFDDDGMDDLAIGIPNAAVIHPGWFGIPDRRDVAGAICVVFGKKHDEFLADGLDTTRAVSLHQGNISYRQWGPTEEPEKSDAFGSVLTSCRNKSGTDRLMVGVPDEWLGFEERAGIVMEINANPSSDNFRETRHFHQNVEGVAGDAKAGDRFGASLACGDFDRDGDEDLAVGIPGERPKEAQAGAVQVFFRDPSGLTTSGNRLWHQGSEGIAGKAEEGDVFGAALVVGDFDGSGVADLAIGIPGENAGSGLVTVLYGRAGSGLSGQGSDTFSQHGPDLQGAEEAGDHFGGTLAAGNFDGNDIFDTGSDGVHTLDDLAIGSFSEDLRVGGETRESAGMVHILRGTRQGILGALAEQQILDRRLPRLPADDPADHDAWGSNLAAGDFDGNGSADLAVSALMATSETFLIIASPGQVDVLYGLRRTLNGFGSVAFAANGTNVPEQETVIPISVNRTGGAVLPASVEYFVESTQATPGADYLPLSAGTLSWDAGDLNSKGFYVRVREDTIAEPNERIRIGLRHISEGTSYAFLRGNSHYDLTIVDDDSPVVTPTPVPVVWRDVINANATANTLTKVGSVEDWDAGAASTRQLTAGDGFVEFTVNETGRHRMCGLSIGAPPDNEPHFRGITFAAYLRGDEPLIAVFESEEQAVLPAPVPYAAGDRIRVAVVGGVVQYSKNGVVFYTSTRAVAYPMRVDASLFSPNAVITDARTSF
jgi:hypothetical protein